ncbi:Myosin-9 [Malassezia pachydermatis]
MSNSGTGSFPSDPDRKDVWVPDPTQGYVAAYVVREHAGDSECCLANGTVVTVPTSSLSEMNPPKFDKAADIADLTYLNEASVVHNLRQRYFSDMIYVRIRQARPTHTSRRIPVCSWSL